MKVTKTMNKKLLATYLRRCFALVIFLLLAVPPSAQARGGGGHGGGGHYHGGGRGWGGRGWGGGWGYGGWGWGYPYYGWGYPYYGYGYPYYGYPGIGIGFTVGGGHKARGGIYTITNSTNRVLHVATTRDKGNVEPGKEIRLEYSQKKLTIRSKNPSEELKIKPLSRDITILEDPDGMLDVND